MRPGTRLGWTVEKEGWAALIFALSISWLAWTSGSLRLSLIAAGLDSVVFLELVLGTLNLRGLHVGRDIDGEVYAFESVGGCFRLTNRKNFGSCWGVRVREAGDTDGWGQSRGSLGRIRSGDTNDLPASWCFDRRGERKLDGIIVESSWPFGFVNRCRFYAIKEQVLVYPKMKGMALKREEGGARGLRPSAVVHGSQSGFRGLRAYQPGDSLRWIHWPTSARTRRPMVIIRPDLESDEVMVEVRPESMDSWEETLSGAVSEVTRSLAAGRAVGLHILGVTHPPRRGGAWRRYLLTQLAHAPESPQLRVR